MSTIPELSWFKSSYSGGDGDNCVEVAVSWFKSSYSGSGGGNCVEVALCPEAVHIRDSKDKEIRPLVVTPGAWAAFTALAAGSSLDG
ncbi:DUF397 domain-containing protein [Streptomyces sp. SID2888]|uniref:DUF397 domain-containing protein n=1 Tax=Streptomyces sp. SID2888 TaxID=2690256 RepID=UPI0013722A2B|nr:DUF397 domain-containing protein [Streptomyces sp. SID2888]MYV49178.1 DUF397 domain-containing protein [Streptomyces sp. SID2888]